MAGKVPYLGNIHAVRLTIILMVAKSGQTIQ